MIDYAYGAWVTVVILIAFAWTFLLALLRPRTRVEWRSLGMTQAFFVALFVEMFGFPLTIYVLSTLLGTTLSFGHVQGHLLGDILNTITGLGPGFGWIVVMGASTVLILAGTMLVARAWKILYAARGGLVMHGPYAYVRHPQYLGLMLVVVGFLVQWPTLITLAMAPFLFWAYSRLARREEQELRRRFPVAYEEYVQKVPRLLPLRRGNPVSIVNEGGRA